MLRDQRLKTKSEQSNLVLLVYVRAAKGQRKPILFQFRIARKQCRRELILRIISSVLLSLFQAADQLVEKFAQVPDLGSCEGSFKENPVVVLQVRVELAKKLDAFPTQLHQDASAILTRMDALNQSSSFQAIQYSSDAALGDQSFLGYFRTIEAGVVCLRQGDQHVHLRK